MYMLELKPFDNHQRNFMHSLSDKVLFRYHDSQPPRSPRGNLEVWVAVMLEFLNLGKVKSKNAPYEKVFSPAQAHSKIVDF